MPPDVTIGSTNAKPNTSHGVTAARAGRPGVHTPVFCYAQASRWSAQNSACDQREHQREAQCKSRSDRCPRRRPGVHTPFYCVAWSFRWWARNSVYDHWGHQAKPSTSHEVTAARAGAPVRHDSLSPVSNPLSHTFTPSGTLSPCESLASTAVLSSPATV